MFGEGRCPGEQLSEERPASDTELLPRCCLGGIIVEDSDSLSEEPSP